MWHWGGSISCPGNLYSGKAHPSRKCATTDFTRVIWLLQTSCNYGPISCFYHACYHVALSSTQWWLTFLRLQLISRMSMNQVSFPSVNCWSLVLLATFGQTWKVLINLCRQVIMIKLIFRLILFKSVLRWLDFWSLETLHINSCLILFIFMWTVCWTWRYWRVAFVSILRLFTFKRFTDKQSLVCFKFVYLLQSFNVIYLRKLKAS